MSEFGECLRCGEPLRSGRVTADGIPDCANECRTRHHREYVAARHAAMVRDMQSLLVPAGSEPAPVKRKGWSMVRVLG